LFKLQTTLTKEIKMKELVLYTLASYAVLDIVFSLIVFFTFKNFFVNKLTVVAMALKNAFRKKEPEPEYEETEEECTECDCEECSNEDSGCDCPNCNNDCDYCDCKRSTDEQGDSENKE